MAEEIENDGSGNNTLRAALEAAVEQHSQLPSETETETPAVETPPAETETDVGRDEKGKFVAKDKGGEGKEVQDKPAKPLARTEKAGPPPAKGEKGKTPPAGTEAPTQAPKGLEKPPQSWRPAAKQHWDKLPPEVREEAHRLNVEIQKTLSEHADQLKQFEPAARIADAFGSAVQPFLPMIQAEGSNPVQAVTSLLRTAAAMRTAPVAYKANMIADMMTRFGVPENLVGDALDALRKGQPPQGGNWQPPAPQQPQEFRDPRVDQLFQSAQQQDYAAAQETVEEWKQDKEFYTDVKDIMADIVDLKEARRQSYDLDEVYSIACQAHPEVRQILQQREEAERARVSAGPRAERASTGLRSSGGLEPGGDEGKESRSIRALLERQLLGE